MCDWVDITAVCREAANELGKRLEKPMVNTPEFSLQESMSAVELMDVKMDQCTPHTSALHNKRWSTLYHYDLPKDLTAVEVLPELQHSFAMLILFLNGASIMESTHQHLHLWQQAWPALEKSTTNPFTKSLIITVGQALILSVSSIYNAVLSADIYEDEDFSPNLRHLLPEAESLNVDDIRKRLSDLKLQVLQGDIAGQTISKQSSNEIIDFLSLVESSMTLFHAIELYVHRTIVIATKLNRDRKQGPSDNQESADGSSNNNNHRDYRMLRADYQQLPKAQDLQAMSKIVTEAVERVLASLPADHGLDLTPSTSHLFHPELAKLHLIVPIRKLEEVTFRSGCESLKKVCHEMLEICEVSHKIPNPIPQLLNSSATNTAKHHLTIEQLLHQGLYFSSKKFHLINRSIYVASIHNIALDVESYIFNSMAQRGVPAAILTSTASTALHEWIVGNPSFAAWETLKTLCISRTRISLRMEHLINLWGNVAAEALYVDEQLRTLLQLENVQQWCTSWSVIFTTTMMDIVMSLVTEMDVLDIKEWDNTYWYWDYICATNSHAVDKLRAHRFQLDMTIYESEQQKKTKKGKKTELPTPVVIAPFAEDLVFKGRGQLCRGIFRTMIVLKQLGLVSRQSNVHTNAGNIFERRFRSFQEVVNPSPLTYKDFVLTINKDASKKGGDETTVDTNGESKPVEEIDFNDENSIQRIVDLKGVINGSIICFQNARKFFDEARKLTSHLKGFSDSYVTTLNNAIVGLTKVAVASSLAITKFSQLVDETGTIPEGTKVSIAFNQSYHISYPVIESKQT